ncbi:MAG: (2Fe-2S)-binding protein [Candidatus Aminicenantes bacterium]|nr:(2Fe-2S)-binding protein [Candidatus Aminicenantes bacterium]
MEHLRIDSILRKQKIKFKLNGKDTEAYEGETVLAALLAAGQKKIKINPVSRKPRGALCGMGVCFECRVTIDGIPNVRACMTEVKPGMIIETNDKK